MESENVAITAGDAPAIGGPHMGTFNMQNTLLGAAAAAGLIVLVFVLSLIMPGKAPVGPTAGPVAVPVATPEKLAASAAQITPGYVGSTTVGEWSVNCAA